MFSCCLQACLCAPNGCSQRKPQVRHTTTSSTLVGHLSPSLIPTALSPLSLHTSPLSSRFPRVHCISYRCKIPHRSGRICKYPFYFVPCLQHTLALCSAVQCSASEAVVVVSQLFAPGPVLLLSSCIPRIPNIHTRLSHSSHPSSAG